MPSESYRIWVEEFSADLDEIEAAHASIGGTGRGRRYATQQINQAYAVLVASKFQGFCRNLHTESVSRLMTVIPLPPDVPAMVRQLVQTRLTQGRQLDSKNAQPSSIGSDFGLLGIKFWQEVYSNHPQHMSRKNLLDDLNRWRNAIAHQNFAEVSPDSPPNLTLAQVRQWRSVCGKLAGSFDEVMRIHLESLIGSSPWPP